MMLERGEGGFATLGGIVNTPTMSDKRRKTNFDSEQKVYKRKKIVDKTKLAI